MQKSSGLPLLIKGYNTDQNGQNNTLGPVASTVNWNNVFDSGRGDVVALDAIETGRPLPYAADTNNTASVLVAGIQVISQANCGDFAPYASPGQYFITPLRQPGGQTLALNLVGVGTSTHGLQVLAFYENQYNTPENRSRLMSSRLKRRWQDQTYNVTVAGKNQTSSQFTVPQGQGTVVGVELLAYLQTGAATSDLGLATLTMYVNGVTIFENVCTIYASNTCTRPAIFSIRINPGDTFSFSTDSSLCGAGVNLALGARFYFADNNE